MQIDWNSIEGYREDMTADERLSLLDGYEFPTKEGTPEEQQNAPRNTAKTVLKSQYDKLASEYATLKKQHRAQLTEEEQREEDRKAESEAMRAELEQLRKEKQLSNYNAAFLSQGYDAKLASEAAAAMAEGDTDGVFAAMTKQRTLFEKSLRAQILKESPVPPASESTDKAKADELNRIRMSMGLKPV